MFIRHLEVRNFRNHAASSVSFDQPVNLITGLNGQGKTNLLDAIYTCSLSKSFQVSNDSHCVRNGEAFYNLSLNCTSDTGKGTAVSVGWDPQNGKIIRIHGQPVPSATGLIGLLPTILLTLEDRAITMGGPSDRRKFMDNLLYQTSSVYIDANRKYRRALKQRNDLLASNSRYQSSWGDLLDSWTEELIRYAAIITSRRFQFVSELQSHVNQIWTSQLSGYEKPVLRYQPEFLSDFSEDRGIQLYREAFEKIRSEESEKRTTLMGPHRDDLLISFNNQDVRYFASQGQHKHILLLLKIASFHYLKEKKDETPVFLMDDFFSELDHTRIQVISQVIKTFGQVFITMTSTDIIPQSGEFAVYSVANGQVTRQ